MGKIIGIDYGTKRVGIAATDELQIIASGLTTVHSSEVIAYLKDYVAKNTVDEIVVGEPKRLNNQDTHSSESVRNFVKHLKREFPTIPIVKYDERFTSSMASQSMLDMGMKKKKRREKGVLDEISAVIILQGYMEYKR